jgi:hypothetical protein
MATPNAINPTLQAIRNTLAAGHRLWLVGGVAFPAKNTLPPNLPPAPQSPCGWFCGPYFRVWSLQVGYVLGLHATHGEAVPVPVDQPICGFEDLPLIAIDGWRGP